MRNEHFAILQKEVKVAARVVAEDCNRAMVRNMELTITVSGRVTTETEIDELLVSYRLGDWDVHAKGSDLGAVLSEFLRRKGWDEANAPKTLAPPRKKAEIDN
jgi:hypothetical protein